MIPRFFDIHAHVHDKAFDADRSIVVERMLREGVWSIMVGTDRKTSQEVVALASRYEQGVYASIGVHPIDDQNETFDAVFFGELIRAGKVVAVGECGLDYSRLEGDGDHADEKRRQKELFEQQIDFALDHNLPLMIHCRDRDKERADAHRDVLAILREKKDAGAGKLRGNVHFFSQTHHIAEEYNDLGFTASFTGVITFTHEYDEVIKSSPLTTIMTETDCPYVAPAPFRGKRNEPSFVTHVVEKIAALRGEDFEVVRAQMVANAMRVFNIQL